MTATHDIDMLPPVVPPLGATRTDWTRDQPPAAALAWLEAGWRDLVRYPWPSLAYGLLISLVSIQVVTSLVHLGYGFILFPALSGFLVVGPLIATGLYEKSRRLARGEPVTLFDMVLVKAASGGQILFLGVLLCLLMLLWNRAAVILYALFFGLVAFPGLNDVMGILLGTTRGWALIVVGSLVGGLFAAFSFAINVFGVPMLLAERTDALTAMGQSMALVWNNRPVMLTWGAIVMVLFGLCLVTGLLGLIVVFPLLGHATWHAYRAMRWKSGPGGAEPGTASDRRPGRAPA
jgi:uncharacterized membrane protein